MKRLLLPLFLSPILLASCSSNKYSSFIEAERACQDWFSDAEWYEVSKESSWRPPPELFGDGFSSLWSTKRCQHDKETRQILGWKISREYLLPENPRRANGETCCPFKQSIEKRFYY